MLLRTEEIKIKDIISKNNIRTKKYDTIKMSELMQSIKQDGLLQPIGVIKNNNHYEILFGNRRLMAIQKLGRDRINATIFKDKNDVDILIINMIENMQRVDVSIYEQGRIVEKLQSLGLTLSEISARLSIPISKVKTIDNIYKNVPKKYRDLVEFMPSGQTARKGKLPASIVNKILSYAREFGISRDNISFILEQARKDEIHYSHLRYLSKLLSMGVPAKEALKKLNNVVIIRIDFLGDKKQIEQLSSKHNISSKTLLITKIIHNEIKEKLIKII